ncbi:hypothetical protein BpHYR1_003395 [Brachionus plicatilis]|uniref:Uncharacterized protein n=1 Tax=Brachionus plicatilis TaxID=10195 RepID=A0A3M7QJB5_BRAPC|nr:hypothetical protein BpHYR1_003395 [Brachionus plicatilis]
MIESATREGNNYFIENLNDFEYLNACRELNWGATTMGNNCSVNSLVHIGSINKISIKNSSKNETFGYRKIILSSFFSDIIKQIMFNKMGKHAVVIAWRGGEIEWHENAKDVPLGENLKKDHQL